MYATFEINDNDLLNKADDSIDFNIQSLSWMSKTSPMSMNQIMFQHSHILNQINTNSNINDNFDKKLKEQELNFQRYLHFFHVSYSLHLLRLVLD